MGGRSRLYLIGVGLSPRYLTLEALNAVSKADVVLAETYTSRLDVLELASLLGRDVMTIGRADLEELSGRVILDLLKEGKTVALLTPGDPLVATTHAAFLLEVHKAGFEFHVIPGVSIVSAALSLSGLMIYKLGKVATVVYPKDGVVFEYPYDVIKINDGQNLHTLLLLEYDGEKGVAMTAAEALELLEDIEKRRMEGVINEDRLAVVAASLGYPDSTICADKLKKLKTMRIKKVPQTLVIIAPKPHPVELELLKVVNSRWCKVE